MKDLFIFIIGCILLKGLLWFIMLAPILLLVYWLWWC